MRRSTPTLALVLTLSMLAVPPAAVAESFDWSGRSDVYAEQLWGTSTVEASHTATQTTSLGWSYRLTDELRVNGFARARGPSALAVSPDEARARLAFESGGLGLGVGYDLNVLHLEIGGVEDTLAVDRAPVGSKSRTYQIAGPYARVGLDLFRWNHLLIQANAQVESLETSYDNAARYGLPQRQAVASAGLSLHAADINSVIPGAVAITALLVMACMKGCGGGSWGGLGGGSGKCKDKHGRPADCRR
jgi:hypothetical protein